MVPEHCRAYALCNADNPNYSVTWDHCDRCERCLLVSSVVRKIEEGLVMAERSDNEKELEFVISQAK